MRFEVSRELPGRNIGRQNYRKPSEPIRHAYFASSSTTYNGQIFCVHIMSIMIPVTDPMPQTPQMSSQRYANTSNPFSLPRPGQAFRAVKIGLTTQLSPVGHTSVRFSCLSSGPVGPLWYLAVRLMPKISFCRGSESGYCSSPHAPV